jgi:hypothetical protein
MLLKSINTLGLVAVLAAGAELVSGFSASADPVRVSDGTTYGTPVVVGNGTVRSYVTYADGEAIEVGVAMSEAVMQGLPGTSGDHGEGHHDMHEFVLDLPAGNSTPFQHVGFNWNPGGHEPPGIYDAPHFDFHFYMIPVAERMAMVPADTADFNARARNYPAAAFVPAGYVAPAPVGIPQMGVHWIDPKSPEFNGKPFTQTFIYGSWNGKLIFAEPMITKALLESRTDLTTPIGAAESYGAPGRYPTSYTVRWNARAAQYEVALTGLVTKN